jgi:translocator protein
MRSHETKKGIPAEPGRRCSGTAKDPGKTKNALIAGSMVSVAAVAGSFASAPDGEWYRTLKKPLWQPPSIVFPVVWSSLYTNIAATSTAVLNELDRRGEIEEAAAYRRSLATNLALNSFWSWLFFRWHHLGAATVGAGMLAASSVDLAKKAGRVRLRFGVALSPYAAWTGFATVLAGTVWWLNRERD